MVDNNAKQESGPDWGAPGPRNLLSDVGGIRVAHAGDARLRSGVTVILADAPVVAAADIRGGGPGTRESDVLGLAATLDHVHGIVFSGGSALGLGAATGVQSVLRERGVGFAIAGTRVPIVPQAILFDLANGGDKDWGVSPPYEALAQKATRAALSGSGGEAFALGSVGVGTGATTALLKGGLGSASLVLDDGLVVGALAVANPAGCATIPGTPCFWAAPYERGGEFGGRGWPVTHADARRRPVLKGGAGANTTLGVVATNARLDKRRAHRLAVMAQTGLTRAIAPAHTPLDGDIVFALATGVRALSDPVRELALIGEAAAQTLARAIARGVYEAGGRDAEWPDPPSYRQRFGLSP